MNRPARLVRVDGPTAGTARPLPARATLLRPDEAAAPSPSGEAAGAYAALIPVGPDWIVRDLGAPGGTLVNDTPLRGDRPLAAGDTIGPGAGGARWRFDQGEGPPPGAASSRVSRRLWPVAMLAVTALVVALAGTRIADRRARGLLLARLDSLAATLDSARRRESQLRTELERTATEVSAVRAQLTTGTPGTTLDGVRGQVDALADRGRPLVAAAMLDVAPVLATSADPTALVLAGHDRGRVTAGSGFAVLSRGDTSWVVTSRHLVQEADGAPAQRLGVIFAGTAQNFAATLERVHPDVDLALLRVSLRGGSPVVTGLAGTVRPGEPVAVVGYAAGLDLADSVVWRREGVHPAAWVGTVLDADGDRIVFDGYGAGGLSGSPVLDATGQVAGVVFGGAAGSGGRLVYAVPVARVLELLEARQ